MCPHRFRAVVGGWPVPECGGPGDVSGCRRGPGLHHGVCEAAPGDAVTGGPSPAGRSPQTASRDPPQVPAGPGARRRSSCGPELSVPTSRAEPAGWLLGFRGRCSPLLRGSPAPPTSASLGVWPGAEPLERERVCLVSRDGQAPDQGACFGFCWGAAPAPDLGPPLLRRWAEARGDCPCVWSTWAPGEPRDLGWP